MTMNKIKALSLMLLLALAANAQAKGLMDNLELKMHLGYNIGGTAPVGMPASRAISKGMPRRDSSTATRCNLTWCSA